jgi:hypothetical protein
LLVNTGFSKKLADVATAVQKPHILRKARSNLARSYMY